jgi:multidrug efflux pump subunit AcrB
MRLTHAFIDRPMFATVLSVFVTLIGLGAMFVLPVAQYPEIVPPTVQIATAYPGASAETVSRTVATPLEQQINGVENMLYMSSQSMGDGKLTITVTFRIGTDLNVAQMLTQNRVQDVVPRLPEDVQRLAVQVSKKTPSILLAVNLYSPDSSRNTLYMSNYATLHIKDVLARLPGVGDVQIIGERQYAMRIWLDPDRIAARNMNASEVFSVLRAQNIQVAAGVLNQPPLETPQEFASIVLKSDSDGRVTRLGDIGRVEIGAADYGATALTDRDPGMPLYIYAEPGANSLAVEHEVLSTIATLSKDFPPGSPTRSFTIRQPSSANRSTKSL